MAKRGFFGLHGCTSYYDSMGRKIGESRPGLFGIVNHYDNHGRKVGSSYHDLFGRTITKFDKGRGGVRLCMSE